MAKFDINVVAHDKASRTLKKVDNSLKKIEKSSKSLNGVLGKVGAALAAFGVGRAFTSIVKIGSAFEDLRDTLSIVEGSANKGALAFDKITKLATKTTFGVEDLTTAYIKLKTAGINPTEKLLMTFADTASVTTDQFGSLTAMTDLFARSVSGGLGLEDLNRLADRGIPVFKILKQELNLTRLEISAYGKSAEGAAKIQQVLLKSFDKTYGGASKAKLDNLSVAQSNFSIQVKRAATIMFDEFGPALAATINQVTAFVAANDALFKTLGTDLVGAIEGASESIHFMTQNMARLSDSLSVGVWTLFGGVLLTIGHRISKIVGPIRKLTTLTAKWNAVLFQTKKTAGAIISKFGLLGKVVVAAGTAFAIMGEEGFAGFGKIQIGAQTTGEIFNALGDMISNTMSNAFLLIKLIINQWVVGVRERANQVIALFVYVGTAIKNSFVDTFEFLSAMIDRFVNQWKQSFTNIIDAASLVKEGEFTKAWETLQKEADGLNLDDLWTKHMGKDVVPNADEIFATDWIAGAGKVVTAIGEIGDAIVDASVDRFSKSGFAMDVKARIQQSREAVKALDAETKAIADKQKALEALAKIPITDPWVTGNFPKPELSIRDEFFKKSSAFGPGFTNEHEGDANLAAHAAKIAELSKSTIGLPDTAAISLAKSMKASNDQIAELEDGLKNASVMAEMFGVSEEKLTDKLKDQLESLKDVGDGLAQHFEQIGQSLSKSMADAMARGELTFDSFTGFMETWAQNLMSKVIQDQLMDPMTDALSSWMGGFGGGGGGGSNMFDSIMGFFSGGFAKGGYIPGGSFGVVGEQGPELITGPANITPINNTSGGAPVNVTINLSAIDSQSGTQFLISKKQEIAGIIQQAYNQQGKNGIY